jgi:hypothetical protein
MSAQELGLRLLGVAAGPLPVVGGLLAAGSLVRVLWLAIVLFALAMILAGVAVLCLAAGLLVSFAQVALGRHD